MLKKIKNNKLLPCYILFFIFFFIARPMVVTGDSMYPTFKNSDFVIIEKITKNFSIKTNDIIVAYNSLEGRNIIKRVIGTPGDTILIKNSKIYINNTLYNDKYKREEKFEAGNASKKIILKEKEYFVLGDNRNNSIDSRFDEIGIINRKEIEGKVLFKF